jgi:peptidyl-prolyl cis-trans isomerase D
MAIIGSIRKRGTLIVVIVGLSLAAFILGGAQNLFTSNSSSVGSFNGEKIDVNKYSEMVNEKKAFVQTINPTGEIDEATEDALKDEVWEDLMRTKVYEKQYRILGLTISDAEFNDMMVGETVDPSIRQQFVNQQGQFDPNLVQQYSQQFEDGSNIPEDKLQEWTSRRIYWGYLQNKLKNDRLQNKYMGMVTKGLYVTTKEATSLYKANSDHANIRFVVKSYATIPDSTVSFTEQELINFFKEHKYRMRSKKSKAIKYAVFLSIPTAGDSAAIKNNITQLRDELAATDDDTLFVAQNSEESSVPMFVKKGVLNPYLDSLLFNAPQGTVAGPTIESGYYIVAKKMTERFEPDSCKARHILIQPKENSEVAVKAAMDLRDSIYTALQNGGNFAELAAKFSTDGSAKDSGNLGWFGKGQMVQEFADSCFKNKKGDLKKVNSQFGFHVVYVIDQTAPVKESQIAMVIKAIKPSEETKQVQFNLANEMAYPDKKVKGFDPVKHMDGVAKKYNLVYRDEASITESSKNILNMEGTKPVVQWALGAKRGDISDIFESGDNYIVAVVTANRPDGIPALDDVRDDAITAFRKHKKAEQFINEFNSAIATSKDINSLAAATKLNVGSANDIAFGSYFVPGAGIEPELLGTAFGIKVNQLSKPIEGNSGVFVLVVDQFNPSPVLPDYSPLKKDIMRSYANRAADALTAIKEKANVKDFRYKFEVF